MKTYSKTSDGDLISARGPYHVIRERYAYTYAIIHNTREMRATLRNGAYAWPGGYPLYFLANDGASLCFVCARAEYKQISDSIRNNSRDGWRVVACDINYEDTQMHCAHCNKLIESAYSK